MIKELERLVERARNTVMTPEQWEVQRRSFAFGNAALANPSITREMIDRAAEAIARGIVARQARGNMLLQACCFETKEDIDERRETLAGYEF